MQVRWRGRDIKVIWNLSNLLQYMQYVSAKHKGSSSSAFERFWVSLGTNNSWDDVQPNQIIATWVLEKQARILQGILWDLE